MLFGLVHICQNWSCLIPSVRIRLKLFEIHWTRCISFAFDVHCIIGTSHAPTYVQKSWLRRSVAHYLTAPFFSNNDLPCQQVKPRLFTSPAHNDAMRGQRVQCAMTFDGLGMPLPNTFIDLPTNAPLPRCKALRNPANMFLARRPLILIITSA